MLLCVQTDRYAIINMKMLKKKKVFTLIIKHKKVKKRISFMIEFLNKIKKSAKEVLYYGSN